MSNWHGYFVIERQNIGITNWNALIALFEAMGTAGSRMPAHNNHWRTRLDGDAVIYESRFDTEEVSIAAFKQLLADEFNVPIEDIQSEPSSASYAGGMTTAWQFLYNAIERFKAERFGDGVSVWTESGDECRGYLATNREEWEEETV